MTVRTAMWMGAAALVLGAAALGGGCGAPFVPSTTGGNGGGGGAGSTASATNASSTSTSTTSGGQDCILGMTQCPTGQYCETAQCGKGTCMAVPMTQTQERNLVCGCDGKTYWNASVAASYGMPVASTDACTTPIPCSATQSCSGKDAHCDIDASDATLGCDPTKATGHCVVLPHQCNSGNAASVCTNQSSCLSPCEAVQSNQPWRAGCK